MFLNRQAAFVLFISVLIALPGCRPSAQPTPRQHPLPETKVAQERQTPAEQAPNPKEAQNVAPPDYSQRAPSVASETTRDNRTLTQKADEIANTVTRIPGVERAAVLLVGRTALVGVDLNSNISGSKIDTTKFSVKESAEHSGGSRGYRVVVSADVDTVTRIRKMAAGMRAGKPISSFTDEIADILSRLLPEV